jgi:hypothetical protein
MEEMRKDTIVYDTETGEIVSEKSEKIKSWLWKDGEGAMIQWRSGHTKIYRGNEIIGTVTDKSDRAALWVLERCVRKDTNIIFFGDKIAGVNEISRLVGLCEKRTRGFLSRMNKIGLIAKVTESVELADRTTVTEYYAFNPVYHSSCKYVSLGLYMAFRAYLDDVLDAWQRKKYAELAESRGVDLRKLP